jgi:hypothetical protein
VEELAARSALTLFSKSRMRCLTGSSACVNSASVKRGVMCCPQPVKVEADDVAARERSREQAGPLSVARLPHGDAVPQPLLDAFAVAARYRGERRFKVLFQQCQTRRLGAAILMASFR